MEVGLALGGTITGEHGDRRAQARLAGPRRVGPVALDVHRAIKAALDPKNLLNPGKVVSE